MRQTSDASGFRFCQEIADALEQERQVQRFFHERIDADANGTLILMGPGGDDNDGHQWAQPANPFKRRPTVFGRHVQIQQHQVARPGMELRDGFFSGIRRFHIVVFRLQNSGEGFPDRRFVLGDEDPFLYLGFVAHYAAV